MFKKHKFTIGAFGIILDKKDRVLLCHRCDYDLWNLPGGALEKGEAPWQCVKREVKEETGLIVKEKLIGIYNKPNHNEIVFQFFCEIKGGKIKLNNEADKIEYFVFKNIPKNISTKQIKRIKNFLSDKNRLILETQEGKSTIELLNLK